jgi:hypothetical protein
MRLDATTSDDLWVALREQFLREAEVLVNNVLGLYDRREKNLIKEI